MNDKVTEDIPCRYCGKWYGHDNNCVYLQTTSGIAERINELEYARNLQSQLATVTKQREEAVKVITTYSDSESRYFVKRTEVVNGSEVHTIKNIVEMTLLAKEFLAKLKREE